MKKRLLPPPAPPCRKCGMPNPPPEHTRDCPGLQALAARNSNPKSNELPSWVLSSLVFVCNVCGVKATGPGTCRTVTKSRGPGFKVRKLIACPGKLLGVNIGEELRKARGDQAAEACAQQLIRALRPVTEPGLANREDIARWLNCYEDAETRRQALRFLADFDSDLSKLEAP